MVRNNRVKQSVMMTEGLAYYEDHRVLSSDHASFVPLGNFYNLLGPLCLFVCLINVAMN